MAKTRFQAKLKSAHKLSLTFLLIITTSLSQLEVQICFGLKYLKTKQPTNTKIIRSLFWNRSRIKKTKKVSLKIWKKSLKFFIMITKSLWWLLINSWFTKTTNPKLKKFMRLLWPLNLLHLRKAWSNHNKVRVVYQKKQTRSRKKL